MALTRMAGASTLPCQRANTAWRGRGRPPKKDQARRCSRWRRPQRLAAPWRALVPITFGNRTPRKDDAGAIDQRIERAQCALTSSVAGHVRADMALRLSCGGNVTRRQGHLAGRYFGRCPSSARMPPAYAGIGKAMPSSAAQGCCCCDSLRGHHFACAVQTCPAAPAPRQASHDRVTAAVDALYLPNTAAHFAPRYFASGA